MTPLEDLENIPPAQWMVKGILAKGSMNMLHSTPKAGKTTLILSLLKAISDGGTFLGASMTRSWTLLLSEQTHQSLAEQLRRAGIDGSSQIHVALRNDQSSAIDPELLAEILWNQYFRLDPAPSLIVIDTLARFIPMGDSNDYSGIIEKMEPLIANCGESGQAVRSNNHPDSPFPQIDRGIRRPGGSGLYQHSGPARHAPSAVRQPQLPATEN